MQNINFYIGELWTDELKELEEQDIKQITIFDRSEIKQITILNRFKNESSRKISNSLADLDKISIIDSFDDKSQWEKLCYLLKKSKLNSIIFYYLPDITESKILIDSLKVMNSLNKITISITAIKFSIGTAWY